MKVLIDANNIGFAAFQAMKLKAGEQETQGVFGFIKTLKVVRDKFPSAELFILWDGRSWRKDRFTDYKANRDANKKTAQMRDAYKKQRPMMARAAYMLGLTQISAANLEADDLAAHLTKKFTAKGEKVVLISGDKDWLQLVKPGVIWIDPVKKRDCTAAKFKEFTGYETPQQFLAAKALQGDSSDNIPGVGGLGEKAAGLIIEHYGSVQGMVKELRAGADLVPELSKFRKKVTDFAAEGSDGIKKFKRNVGLMTLLHTDAIPKAQEMKVRKGKFDEDTFSELCGELAFHSVLKNMDNWKESFA